MVNRFSGRHTAPVTNKQLVSQTRNQETGNRVGRSSAHSSFDAACIDSVSKSRRACKFGASCTQDIYQFSFGPSVGPGSVSTVICHRDWSIPDLVVQSQSPNDW